MYPIHEMHGKIKEKIIIITDVRQFYELNKPEAINQMKKKEMN